MYAVIFEVKPLKEGKEEYLEIAAGLRKFLEDRDGFISIERFQSLNVDRKILSLSFWKNEESITEWRNLLEHRNAQRKGKEALFHSYRIRVAHVIRDYTESNRIEAPADSNSALTKKA
jgi:heme-degrading monooxygenase HmoA